MSAKKIISVFMPVYNGQKYLRESLDVILSQKLPKDYSLEVIVTDSGSTDKSMEILRGYGNKILVNEIPNSEYGHGKTRQAAAEQANGEFILFITQDATPTAYSWVMDMLEPFTYSKDIMCVFGKQVPRFDAAPTIKREVSSVFNGFGPDNSLIIHKLTNSLTGKRDENVNTFFSDVNSAVRRPLLVESIPFRDVAYAEDQALAWDILEAGYQKAYSGRGAVWHSNEYSAKDYYHRKFDEYIGLQESVHLVISASRKSLLLGWIRPSIADLVFTLKDKDYSLISKLYWMIKAPLYNIAAGLGRYHASKFFNDTSKRKKLSLEAKNKNKR